MFVICSFVPFFVLHRCDGGCHAPYPAFLDPSPEAESGGCRARAVRGLDRLVADPLAWRWRDGAYQDYVGGQFARAYGSGPAARDETGKPLPPTRS